MPAPLHLLNLDILKTIKPLPASDPILVVFAIDLNGPKWHRDYFFAFMKAHYYEACADWTQDKFSDKDRWLTVRFYDNSPDYLVVIEDMLYRTNGNIEAVYSYAQNVAQLNDGEMGVVYDYLIRNWNRFRMTKTPEEREPGSLL